MLDAEREGQLEDPTSRLRYAIQAMHLVAACADGPNETVARKLRGVYSLRSLADVLRSSVNAQMKNAAIRAIMIPPASNLNYASFLVLGCF